jgi:hypothetical protein
MRNPADDAADQRGSDSADSRRSRYRVSRHGGGGFRSSRHNGTSAASETSGSPPPGGTGRHGGGAPGGATPGGRAERRNSGGWPVTGPESANGSSVFTPGYDTSRPHGEPPPGASGSSWYGSAAGGAAGKGPVRGYPPAPGQPPPVYPPGQFAAWNRGPSGQAGQSSPAGQGSQPGRGPQPERSYPGRTGPDGGQPVPGGQQPSWQATPGSGRYYGRDDGLDSEPGYSTLAVSDPAADVTSTQTWQAVEEGRATGIWTAPARPGATDPGAAAAAGPGSDPSAPAGRRGTSGRHTMRPSVSGQHSVLAPDPAGPGERADGEAATGAFPAFAGATAAAGTPAAAGTAAGTSAPGGLDGTSDHFSRRPGHRGDRSSDPTLAGHPAGAPDGSAVSTSRGHGRASGTGTLPRTDPASRRGSSSGGKRGKRPASVKLAVGVATLLVVAAAGTLGYTVLHRSPKPKPVAAQGKQSPAATPSPSPSLGPYGHIASRSGDPKPLTIAQLYPSSFTVSGQSVRLTTSKLGTSCASAVVGGSLRTIVGQAHCSQVARASYVSSSQGVMGTIGVLNLGTAAGATKAARKASASDFISQLKAKRGPTHKLGQGTGIEEAAAKGHYLILIWAEFTSLHKPKTNAQRIQIENFMTELLHNTANVTLTTRMLTGTP